MLIYPDGYRLDGSLHVGSLSTRRNRLQRNACHKDIVAAAIQNTLGVVVAFLWGREDGACGSSWRGRLPILWGSAYGNLTRAKCAASIRLAAKEAVLAVQHQVAGQRRGCRGEERIAPDGGSRGAAGCRGRPWRP